MGPGPPAARNATAEARTRCRRSLKTLRPGREGVRSAWLRRCGEIGCRHRAVRRTRSGIRRTAGDGPVSTLPLGSVPTTGSTRPAAPDRQPAIPNRPQPKRTAKRAPKPTAKPTGCAQTDGVHRISTYPPPGSVHRGGSPNRRENGVTPVGGTPVGGPNGRRWCGPRRMLTRSALPVPRCPFRAHPLNRFIAASSPSRTTARAALQASIRASSMTSCC